MKMQLYVDIWETVLYLQADLHRLKTKSFNSLTSTTTK